MSRQLRARFGLKWNPFQSELPIEALYLSPEIEHFSKRLEQLVQSGGFAMLCGDPGSGKSAAMRLVAHHLNALPEICVGVLIRPQSLLADFYRELGELFAVPLSAHNRWRSFKDLRQRWHAHLKSTLLRPVLLIDEAQELRPFVLSELRMLSAMDFDSKSILTVVLCGDQRLLEHLQQPDMLPIQSRLRVRLKLEPKTPRELALALDHLLEQAGAPQLMTPELKTALCEHSAGNLRALCTAADELLAQAELSETAVLDEKLFLETFATKPRARRGARS